MCLKDTTVKRLFVILNVSSHSCFYSQPTVVGIVKQYPLYRQIYEDTKYRDLNSVQLERLGLEEAPNKRYRMIELTIPIKELT